MLTLHLPCCGEWRGGEKKKLSEFQNILMLKVKELVLWVQLLDSSLAALLPRG